jgi:hypothetical protein
MPCDFRLRSGNAMRVFLVRFYSRAGVILWREQWYKRRWSGVKRSVSSGVRRLHASHAVPVQPPKAQFGSVRLLSPRVFYPHRPITPLFLASRSIESMQAHVDTTVGSLGVRRSLTDGAVFYTPRAKSLRRRVTWECAACLRLRPSTFRRRGVASVKTAVCSVMSRLEQVFYFWKGHLRHAI